MSDIQFVQVDAKKINNELINNFETALGDTFYPGDERRIFLEQQTPIIVGLKNDINETGRQNLLRYAKGPLLDALGERVNTPRLKAKKAQTTLRFTLSSAQPQDVYIGQGVKATPDGKLYYMTKSHLTIPAGQLYGDVAAEAVNGGTQYNNFAPGQIKSLFVPISYVASVQNIDISSGGSDIEPDDDGINIWSGYRERIRQAPAGFSTAGPEDAYISWAKTADINIQDVAVTSPSEGRIKISVLMKGGESPAQQVLDSVLLICSDKKIRPLTDHVIAAPPLFKTYNIDLIYYISKEKSAEELNIKSAIEEDGGVIDQYTLWQGSKFKRAINPDDLRQLIRNAGAYKIDITSPIYTEINEDEVAKAGTVTVTYGGLK